MSGELTVEQWGQLYKTHKDAMYRVARAGLGHNRANADPLDIVHDAFESVMKNPPDKVSNWEGLLVSTTLRRVIDHHKHTEQQRTRLTTGGTDSDLETAGAGPAGYDTDIAEEIVRRAEAEAIRADLHLALEQLPDRQRDVANRRILQSQTVTEIAAELGTSSANVSALLRKALAAITPILDRLDVNPSDIGSLRRTRPPGDRP